MRKFIAAAAAAAVLSAGTTAPASAAEAPNDTNFHGTWTSWVHGDQPAHGYYGGHWNVSVKKDGTANMSMVLFSAPGQLYTLWGGKNAFPSPFVLTSSPGDYPVELHNLFLNMEVSLTASGAMTFRFDSPEDSQRVILTGTS